MTHTIPDKKKQPLPGLMILLAALTLLCGCRSLLGLGGYQKLKEAEELSRQGQLDGAIQAYREHMEYRLKAQNRPDWENPYFYYLLIGDLELGQDKVEEALKSYKIAEERGIHKTLISDRYRFVAGWYEERGEYEDAIALLKKHRALDELLFDAVLDRLSKTMLSQEQERKNPPGTPDNPAGIQTGKTETGETER